MKHALAQINKLVDPVKTRIRLMVSRAVVRVVNDAGKLQLLQVSALKGETLDGLEVFGSWGLASRPHAGAEAIIASVGGVRSHAVVIGVEDKRYRLKPLKSGEVALYDDQGQIVILTREGIVIKSPLPVSIESEVSLDLKAPEITMTANTITADADLFETTGDTHLGGSTKAVARHDDTVVAGKVVATSTKVKAG